MKKICWIICILIVLMLLIPVTGIADFGDFGGSSDYGSSSSWSSSSSDWGDSWSSSSSGWNSPTIFYGGSSSDDISVFSIAPFVIALIIIVAIVMSRRSSTSGGSSGSGANVPEGAQRTPDSKLTAMSAFMEKDPNFSESGLGEKLSNLYVQMQNGWTAKDISALEPYFTDALFRQYQRQLEKYKEAGRTNYVENIAVLGVNIRGWYSADNYDHIIAELRTRIVDYTVDDKTGNIISGSKNFEKFMTYEWDLSRKSGVKTESGDTVRTINCPNCGAPLSINTTAHCPYCDSIVTVDHNDWAINGIKGISQRTVSR